MTNPKVLVDLESLLVLKQIAEVFVDGSGFEEEAYRAFREIDAEIAAHGIDRTAVDAKIARKLKEGPLDPDGTGDHVIP